MDLRWPNISHRFHRCDFSFENGEVLLSDEGFKVFMNFNLRTLFEVIIWELEMGTKSVCICMCHY